jgi:hypothetical protein
MSARHARFMIWSKRKRGRVQRTHMKRAMMTSVLAKKTSARMMHSSRLSVTDGVAPLPTLSPRPGRCHPPKKRATQTADVVIMPAYSARKNRAKRIELYSVW